MSSSRGTFGVLPVRDSDEGTEEGFMEGSLHRKDQMRGVDVSNSNRLDGHFIGLGGYSSGPLGLGLVKA